MGLKKKRVVYKWQRVRDLVGFLASGGKENTRCLTYTYRQGGLQCFVEHVSPRPNPVVFGFVAIGWARREVSSKKGGWRPARKETDRSLKKRKGCLSKVSMHPSNRKGAAADHFASSITAQREHWSGTAGRGRRKRSRITLDRNHVGRQAIKEEEKKKVKEGKFQQAH